MAENVLKYIIDRRGKLVAILPARDSTLVFIPDENRWGRHDRLWSQIVGASIYESGREQVRKTTTIYKCPCGKGTFCYTKEHTGFDDWYTSLNCDDCKKNYYSA